MHISINNIMVAGIHFIFLQNHTTHTMFQKIGNYPHATPYKNILKKADENLIELTLSYMYKIKRNDHLIFLPESCTYVIKNPGEAVVTGPLRPCLQLMATNIDDHAKKVLTAHLYYENSKKLLSQKIKKTFKNSSPDNIKIILHSTLMTHEDYSVESMEQGKIWPSWQAQHNNLTQPEVMREWADTLSSHLSIPQHNIEANLFIPDSSDESEYSFAPFCTITDISGNLGSIDLEQENILDRESYNVFTLPNKKRFDYQGPNDSIFAYLDKEIYPLNGLRSQYDSTDTYKIKCLNCNNCVNCLHK